MISGGPAINQFELKIFPSVSSTWGNHRKAFKGLREVSTTSNATHTGQYENLLRPRGVARAASTTKSKVAWEGKRIWGVVRVGN